MEKDIKIFKASGLNKDDDLDLIQGSDSRNRVNVGFMNGNYDDLLPRFEPDISNLNVDPALPSGTNKIIGRAMYDELHSVILFYANTNGDHSIVLVDYNGDASYVSRAESFWNFRWNTGADGVYMPIHHAVIVGDGDDATLVWTDNFNPIRAININDFIDGYPLTATDNNANLHKPAPVDKITGVVMTDTGNKANNIYGKYFQFSYRYIYDNKQKTTLSNWSDVLYDYNNEYAHTPLVTDLDLSNFIRLTIPIDYSNVDKVEILVRDIDIGSGAQGVWYVHDTVDASVSSITYDFYNNKYGYVYGEDEAIRLFDDVPDLARALELINENRLVVGGLTKGLDNPTPDVILGPTAYDDLTTTSTETAPSTSGTIANSGGTGNISFAAAYSGSEAFKVRIVFSNGDEEEYDLNDSGSQGSAANCATYFVTLINDLTTHSIVAAVSGGTGIQLTNNEGTHTCVMTLYKFTVYEKAKTLHTIATHYFGMRYYDKFGKCGSVITGDDFILNLNNLGSHYPSITGSRIDERIWRASFVIGHLPPSWAVSYQWMYGGSNITKYFSLPIKFIHGTDSDVVAEGGRTRIDLGSALDRFLTIHGIDNYENYFFPSKGDRVLFRMVLSTSLPSSIITSYDRDSVVLEVDSTNDYVYIANTNEIFKPIGGSSTIAYMITEFYSVDPATAPEERIYREVGDIIPVTSGYHEATGDTAFNGVVVQNQTAVLDALGSIKFGDSYVLRQVLYYDPTNFLTGYLHNLSPTIFHDSEYSGVGRYGVFDPEAGTKFFNSVQWSGVWRDDSLSYTELNRFESGDIKYLNDKHGEITSLVEMGYTLYVFQRSKLTPIEIGRQTVEQDGQFMVVDSNVVLGSQRPFKENYGTVHAGGITQYGGVIYFFDHQNATMYRLAQNGITDIAKGQYKMKSYFLSLSELVSGDPDNYMFYSFYDAVTGCYVLFMKDFDTPDNNWTLSFDVSIGKWQCLENYGDDGGVCLSGSRVFSFIALSLYKHHDTTSDYELGYLDVHFNSPPLVRKKFKNITIDSDRQWSTSDNPSIWVDTDMPQYQDQKTNIYYRGEQQSHIPDIRYKRINGQYKASFLRNRLLTDGTDGGEIKIYNGSELAGKHITVRLTNTDDTNENRLRGVIIGYQRRK